MHALFCRAALVASSLVLVPAAALGQEGNAPPPLPPRVEIAVPRGWRRIEGPLPDSVRTLHLLKEEVSGESPTIIVQWNHLPRDYYLDEYLAALRKNSSELYRGKPGVEVLEREKIVSLGKRKFVFSAVRQGEVAILYYHLLEGRDSITVGGSFPAQSLARYRKVMEAVARSLEVAAPAEPGRDREAEPPAEAGSSDLTALDLATQGVRFAKQGDHARAIRLYEEALAKGPRKDLRAEILFSLSSSHLESGILPYLEKRDESHYRKSLKYAQESLKLRPSWWLPLADMGTVHMNMQNLEEAQRLFEEALRQGDPKDPRYRQLMLHHSAVKGTLQAKKDLHFSTGLPKRQSK